MDPQNLDTRFIDDCVAGCAASHQALLALLDSVSHDDIDSWCAQPSLLPNWSRGYVLAHLARNADSHSHLFSEAALGREGEQYAGGLKGRAEGIAAEAKLSGKELVRRTRESIYQLEAAWARSPGEAWLGNGKMPWVQFWQLLICHYCVGVKWKCTCTTWESALLLRNGIRFMFDTIFRGCQ